MFTRKPLFLIESDQDTEGSESDAPEVDDSTESQDDQSEVESDDDAEDVDDEEEEPLDVRRALKKIRKANAEARALRERAQAAEQGLEPAKREAALQRVARRLSLPDSKEVDAFLDRLKGDTIEELLEDAERLLSLLAPKGGSRPGSTRPTERLRGGGDPDEEPEPDLHKIAADIPRR